MFEETKQYFEILNYDKTKSFNLRIIPKVDRGFFPTGPENDFTCYRRNYFQISVSFTADNIKSRNEFTTPCVLKVGNDYLTVDNFYIGICAKVKGGDKEIRVVQQTAKREKGPQNKPALKLCKPGGNPNYYHGLSSNQSIVTFERLQFKSATPNSSKRSGSKQFYSLVIELYADTQHKRCKVATIESKRLIVRGRSPGHYLNGNFDNDNTIISNQSISSTSSGNPSSNGSYYDNGNQGYDNNNGSFTNGNNYFSNYGNGNNITAPPSSSQVPVNFNNNPSSNQISVNYSNAQTSKQVSVNYNNPPSNQVPVNYSNNYTNNQNMNIMTVHPNNGQFQSNINSNQSPYTPSYSQLPYNDRRNGYDNYNSTVAAPSTFTGTSYPNENSGTTNNAGPSINYQNNISSTGSSNSFYPLNNSSVNSSSQSGYMYQTPPLPSHPTPQSINTSIQYNVPKQDMISPYSADSQNTYSPYVQGPVNIFSSQTQSSPVSYPSNNYYSQNANTNAPQNVNTTNNSK